MNFPLKRMRRLRKNKKIRDMVSETVLTINDLIFPIFVKENIENPEPIQSMPGNYRLPIEYAVKEAEELVELGIPATILFGIPREKDEVASQAYAKNGIIQQAVREIKREVGDKLLVITDICSCEYMSHGHCGIVEGGKILNDPTLKLLAKIAVSKAEAGADIIAPSDMMDGRVLAIRKELDREGFEDVAIMSYAAKYASSFYGPFREAAGSAPSFGDRATYQMDPRNVEEALHEVELDIREGADIVMVKPALAYLDVLYRIKTKFKVVTAAYNVSGEFAMIKAAAEKKWIDEKRAVIEILTSIKRAGADMILTYFAKDIAKRLKGRG